MTTTSASTRANTLDTNYAYANALLGNFTTYTETDGFADVKGSRPTVEFYGQDTWKVSATLTVDYGIRFLWFRPWASTGEGTRSASFDPDRYVAGGFAAALSARSGSNNVQPRAESRDRRAQAGRCTSARSCRTRVTPTTAW